MSEFQNKFLRLISTARTKMRIGIYVLHQDSCNMVGCRLSYSGVNRNKVYVKMIDKLYVIVHDRRR